MNNGKALLSILGGVALGATLGVLFAPDKGAYTRMKISKKGEKYADDMGEKFNEFIDGITQKFDAMRKEFAHMAENGKAKTNDAKAEVAAALK